MAFTDKYWFERLTRTEHSEPKLSVRIRYTALMTEVLWLDGKMAVDDPENDSLTYRRNYNVTGHFFSR